jgi:transcription initiation factor TFIID TATA-box-binding protein
VTPGGGRGLKYLFKYYIYLAVTRIRIENVVASTSLGAELDLQSIAFTLDDAEYEPDRFPGLIYRLKQPKTAILLFHSGKAVCTGGKSWRQVDDTIRTVSQLIRRGGQKILMHPKIQVQNIVATSNLESEINLNSVAITLGLDRVEYEPEQFPGLVCRLEEPRVVVLLFGSGKLVCTGARRPSDVALAVEKITKELQGAGLLRREPGPANPSPNRPSRSSRSSTVVPASPSPGPAPPSEASATPTALAASSSPDPLRTERVRLGPSGMGA